MISTKVQIPGQTIWGSRSKFLYGCSGSSRYDRYAGLRLGGRVELHTALWLQICMIAQ